MPPVSSTAAAVNTDDVDNDNIIAPYFVFGHSSFAQRDTLFALSDHSFIHSSGSKLAVHSQAQGGKAAFLPGLARWEHVSCACINDEKTHLAVCVRGYIPEEEEEEQQQAQVPPSSAFAAAAPPGGRATKVNIRPALAASSAPPGGPDGDENANAAIIIYKLPVVVHGASNPDKKSGKAVGDIQDGKSQEEGKSAMTAIIESSVEVTVPKKVRRIVYSPPSSEHSGEFGSCAFSVDGKMLFVQTKSPDCSLLVYDWSRSKLLGSLPLEVEANRIAVPTNPLTNKVSTSGPDHLCFWSVGPGAREVKPGTHVKDLDTSTDGHDVNDHAWLHDDRRVAAVTSGGRVLIVDETEGTVVQLWTNAHEGRPVQCVLAFPEGTTGAASLGDADDVHGFLTVGAGGLLCIFHYDKDKDNNIAKCPYFISQRMCLLSGLPGPAPWSVEGQSNFLDVLSLSLGPDIGDACLLFFSTPSGVLSVDIGQLDAEVDKESFAASISNSAGNTIVAAAAAAAANPVLPSSSSSVDSSGSNPRRSTVLQGRSEANNVRSSNASAASSVTGAGAASSQSSRLKVPENPALAAAAAGPIVVVVAPPPYSTHEPGSGVALPPINNFKNLRQILSRHAGRIASLSVCSRRPLIASCSADGNDSSVRIWNYHTREVLVHEYFPGLQHPSSVSIHPAGNELLVGFDDNVKIYHVLADSMKLASEVNIKQMMHVRKRNDHGAIEDKLVMNPDSVSLVKYTPGGNLFAVVTGKFVQIFQTYGYVVGGQPRRLTVLVGHACPITDLHWSADGRGLHTVDSGGAIYEWRSTKSDRIRETMLGKNNIGAVTSSRHGGCLVAVGGGIRERQLVDVALKERERRATGFQTYVGRRLMFNPKKSVSMQERRKAAAATQAKKNAASIKKASSVASDMGSFDGSEEPGAPGSPKRQLEKGKAALVGWGQDIESSSKTTFDKLDTWVSAITCTFTDDWEKNRFNYAFAFTVSGQARTFKWNAAVGLYKDNNPDDSIMPFEPCCKRFALHQEEVTAAIVSPCQNWLFTASNDGCIIMSALSAKSADSLKADGKGSSLMTLDEELVLSDVRVIAEAKERVTDIETQMVELKTHLDFKLKNLTLESERALNELSRDKTTTTGGLEKKLAEKSAAYESLRLKSAADLVETEHNHEKKTLALEQKYEKRISDDMSSYMDLKNAYDDLVVAATDDRLNLEEVAQQEKNELAKKFSASKDKLLQEQETLKDYNEYVKARYNEVLDKSEVVNDVRVADIRAASKSAEEALKKHLYNSQSETSMMQRQNKVLRDAIEQRDLKNYEMKGLMEAEKKKIELMKEEEVKLVKELEKESARANKWEQSSGGQRRQILELEKVRKVLTNQIHELRGMLEPKDVKIGSVVEKLKELETEYESAITHAADLDKDSNYKDKRIGSLSDTVRRQQSMLADKDTALQSVVTQVNMCVQEIVETGDWKTRIQTLKRVINPYLSVSKSEAIRNAMGDTENEVQRLNHTRRLLETKVDQLEKKLAANSSGNKEVEDKLLSDNTHLMEQLNEIRKAHHENLFEIKRLRSINTGLNIEKEGAMKRATTPSYGQNGKVESRPTTSQSAAAAAAAAAAAGLDDEPPSSPSAAAAAAATSTFFGAGGVSAGFAFDASRMKRSMSSNAALSASGGGLRPAGGPLEKIDRMLMMSAPNALKQLKNAEKAGLRKDRLSTAAREVEAARTRQLLGEKESAVDKLTYENALLQKNSIALLERVGKIKSMATELAALQSQSQSLPQL